MTIRKSTCRFLSVLLALVFLVGLIPSELITFKAKAATSGYYKYSVTNGEAKITDVDTSISGEITIPSTLGGYPVTSIGDRAFFWCESLTSITIPDSVTSIGDDAFYSCDSLTAINVNSQNTAYKSIDGVLYSRDEKTLITCPGGKIGDFSIPDSVTSIGGYAFKGCDSLKSITIPDSVTSIGYGAFYYCKSLTAINVNSQNTAYKSIDGVLYSKDEKTLITCPGGKIGDFSIPDSVTSIGYGAFYNCDSLKNITIPDSVTSIGNWAFSYCYSLTSITIPNSVTSIGDSAFHYCKSLTSITIPDSVTSIGEYAFMYCTSLTSITIPDSVASIGDHAFRWCESLKSITIPDGVTSIGNGAFSYCDSLKDVWYTGTEEQKNKISIEYNNTELTSATWHYNTCKEHTYSSLCDAECNLCDWVRETEAEHTYTNSSDTTCNECGKERIAPDSEYYFDEAKGTMPNVVANTLVSDLISTLEEYGITATVTDKDGNVLEGTKKVGTDCKVITPDGEFSVIVKGDVTGDGSVSSTDYLQVKSAMLGKINLEGYYYKAADCDNDDKISSTDYLKLKNHFLGNFDLYA